MLWLSNRFWFSKITIVELFCLDFHWFLSLFITMIFSSLHYDDLFWFHGLENRILEPYFFYSLHFMHRFIRCVSSRMKSESKVNFIHLLKPIKKNWINYFVKKWLKFVLLCCQNDGYSNEHPHPLFAGLQKMFIYFFFSSLY